MVAWSAMPCASSLCLCSVSPSPPPFHHFPLSVMSAPEILGQLNYLVLSFVIDRKPSLFVGSKEVIISRASKPFRIALIFVAVVDRSLVSLVSVIGRRNLEFGISRKSPAPRWERRKRRAQSSVRTPPKREFVVVFCLFENSTPNLRHVVQLDSSVVNSLRRLWYYFYALRFKNGVMTRQKLNRHHTPNSKLSFELVGHSL